MANPYTDPARPPNPRKDVDKFLDWVSNASEEDKRFERIVMTKDALTAILSSPVSFKRAELMLTGNNRFLLQVAAQELEKRLALVYPKVCELTESQMIALNYIFPITEYPLLLRKRADPVEKGGCGDTKAKVMLDQLVDGDRTALEIELQKGVELTGRARGLKGLFLREENIIAGDILLDAGLISREEYDAKIREMELKRQRTHPEMKVCPGCRQYIARYIVDETGTRKDLGNFVEVITQPYKMEELYCVNCARAGQAAGTLEVIGELPPEIAVKETIPSPRRIEVTLTTPAPPPEVEIPVRKPAAERPAAAFQADKYEGPAPLLVKFTDASMGQVDARHWEFGDGQSSTDPEVTHIFHKPGTYNVVLVVTGPGGLNTTSRIITVKPELEKPKVTAPPKVIGMPQVSPTQPPSPPQPAREEAEVWTPRKHIEDAIVKGRDVTAIISIIKERGVSLGDAVTILGDIAKEYGPLSRVGIRVMQTVTVLTAAEYKKEFEKRGMEVPQIIQKRAEMAAPAPAPAAALPAAPGVILGAGKKMDVLRGLRKKGLSEDRIIKFWKEQGWELELLKKEGIAVAEGDPPEAPLEENEAVIDEMTFPEIREYIMGLGEDDLEKWHDSLREDINAHPGLSDKERRELFGLLGE